VNRKPQWIGIGDCQNLDAPESVSVQPKRAATPERFQGHRENLQVPRQTYTFLLAQFQSVAK